MNAEYLVSKMIRNHIASIEKMTKPIFTSAVEMLISDGATSEEALQYVSKQFYKYGHAGFCPKTPANDEDEPLPTLTQQVTEEIDRRSYTSNELDDVVEYGMRAKSGELTPIETIADIAMILSEPSQTARNVSIPVVSYELLLEARSLCRARGATLGQLSSVEVRKQDVYSFSATLDGDRITFTAVSDDDRYGSQG